MEVFHVVLPRRLEVEQNRRFAAHPVQRMQVEVESDAAGNRGQVHDAVGRTTDGQQDAERVLERGRRENAIDRQLVARHLHRLCAGQLGDPDAVRGDGRGRRAAGHRHAERLRNARHRARRAHHRARAHARDELIVHVGHFVGVDFAGAELAPVTAAIGACAHAFAAVRAGQHGSGDELDRRNARGCRAHQLGRHRLVAAADQHDCIHRLRADHFLGVHRHEVAQVHAGRRGEALVDGDRRERHRQAAGKHDAAFDRGDELRRIAVTGIEVAAGVGNADHGPLQGRIREPGTLDESLAQIEREFVVAVADETATHACRFSAGGRLRFVVGFVGHRRTLLLGLDIGIRGHFCLAFGISASAAPGPRCMRTSFV